MALAGLGCRVRRARPNPFVTAAFRPSLASETTSFAPARRRRFGLRRQSGQNGSASELPTATPGTSRRPSVFTTTAMAPLERSARSRGPWRRWRRARVRPIAPMGRARRPPTRPAIPAPRRETWLRLVPSAHGTHQLVHRAGGDALDMGLPDHRRQRLRGGPAGLRGSRGAGAAPSPGDPQLARTGAGLPVALPLAVAQPRAVGVAPAGGGAGHRAPCGSIRRRAATPVMSRRRVASESSSSREGRSRRRSSWPSRGPGRQAATTQPCRGSPRWSPGPAAPPDATRPAPAGRATSPALFLAKCDSRGKIREGA
jgi:hypothetical protein